MSITVQNITKRYGRFQALTDVNFEAKDGVLMALLGPSGSGKTTLLRVIAGLEVPDAGQILFRDSDVTSRSARDRNIGFVFQHYALFRHMTVFENVAFGLRVRHRPDKEVATRVHDLLHLIRMEEFGGRYPNQLSGGQRQRVALARALAPRPHILLLDEPFGALDAQVRKELRVALRRLHDELHVTSLFVTHDQEEAFEVADEVVVMNEGKVEQSGTPQHIYAHPATPFVMDFIGQVKVLPNPLGGSAGKQSGVIPPPHRLDISREFTGPDCVPAKVVYVYAVAGVVKVRLHNVPFQLAITVDVPAERAKELDLKPGETVFVFPRKI